MLKSTARVFGAAAIVAILSSGCGGPADQPTGPGGSSKRTFFIPNEVISTRFEYDANKSPGYRIPTGANIAWKADNSTIARVEDVQMVAEDNEHRLRATLKLLPKGEVVSTLQVWYEPGTGGQNGSLVRKVVVDGKWESKYFFDGAEGRSGIPRVVTTDLTSGKKVAETQHIEVVGDGSFTGEELCYEADKVVCRSTFKRHAGTGLLLEETFVQGDLPRDYHHYELVLKGWPDGTR
jgi:hypothetical protein